MTTSLDTIRYHSGIAGEEVADMVDSLEQEVSTLREQVEKLMKERDALKTVPMKYRRMQFNAELQEEVTQLQKQLAALAEQNEKQRKALLSANDFIFTLQQDLHSERCTDWYPEGAHNAAESMSESMRLIGNSCADFTDVVEALTIPDLATPVLNRIRAEGMRMAAQFIEDKYNFLGEEITVADEIRAKADELEKGK